MERGEVAPAWPRMQVTTVLQQPVPFPAQLCWGTGQRWGRRSTECCPSAAVSWRSHASSPCNNCNTKPCSRYCKENGLCMCSIHGYVISREKEEREGYHRKENRIWFHRNEKLEDCGLWSGVLLVDTRPLNGNVGYPLSHGRGASQANSAHHKHAVVTK